MDIGPNDTVTNTLLASVIVFCCSEARPGLILTSSKASLSRYLWMPIAFCELSRNSTISNLHNSGLGFGGIVVPDQILKLTLLNPLDRRTSSNKLLAYPGFSIGLLCPLLA
jgi:ethanolamine ammonia-lyase small subunit